MNPDNHQIAFLHTARAHIRTFDALLDKRGQSSNEKISVRHDVDEALLSDAVRLGLTPEIIARTEQAITNAGNSGARIIICTCSTLGAIAEAFDSQTKATVIRIDRPMADLAVTRGQQILIVAALASTLTPTRALLATSAHNLGKSPTLNTLLLPNCWAHFLAGDEQTYLETIATRIEQIEADQKDSPDLIVLAQASMATAADLCTGTQIPILGSPDTGIAAALDLLRSFDDGSDNE
jgi:hypothetical protein